LSNIGEILSVADGLVIARGYLGLSLRVEDAVYA
jgi:pyruvate kinase